MISRKHTAMSSKHALSASEQLITALQKHVAACNSNGYNIQQIDAFLKRISPLVPNQIQDKKVLYAVMAPLGFCEGLSESCEATDLLIRLQDITRIGRELLTLTDYANSDIKAFSMPVLQAYDKAIQRLNDEEVQDPGVISRVDIMLFQTMPLDVDCTFLADLREGVLSEIRLRKQSALHDSIHALMRAMISQSRVPGTVFNHDFIVEDDDFFENDKVFLRSVASAFFNPLESTPSGQWLQLACLNYRIGDPLLFCFLASGPSGDTLDGLLKQVTKFSDRLTPLQEAFTGFITEIRTRQSGGTDAELRFLEAEKRIGTVVETVLKYPRMGSNQAGKIIASISSWRKGLADVCSVGYDLQLLDFEQEINAILEPSSSILNEVPSLSALAVAFQSNIMTVLLDIGVPLGLHADVHHVNLALKLFMDHRGMDVPATLQDPNRPGFQDLVEEKKSIIFSCLSRPDLLLKYIDCSGDMSKLGIVLEGLVAQGILSKEDRFSNLTLDQIEAFSLALLTLDDVHLNTVFSDNHALDGFHEFLKTKGLLHGVVGLSARVGNASVFTRAFAQVKLKTPSDVEDIRGMNLLEYAVLGGCLAIYTQVFESLPETFRLTDFFESRTSANGRTLFALAAESGRVEIFDALFILFDDHQKRPFYMSAPDQDGYTPLMRAGMSGNPDLLRKFLTTMCPLDAVNLYGQTALHLAVSFGTVETVDLLLSCGGVPLHMAIPSSGFNIFHLAMLRDDMAIIERLSKVRCYYNIDDGIAAKDRAGIRPFEYAKNGKAVLPFLCAAVRWSNEYFRDGYSQNPFVKDVKDVAFLALHSGKLTAEDWISIVDFSLENKIHEQALPALVMNAIVSQTLQKAQLIQILNHLPREDSFLGDAYNHLNESFSERLGCLRSDDAVVNFCQFWNTVNDSFGEVFGDTWHYPVARLMRPLWRICASMELLFDSSVFSTDTLLTIVKRLGQEVSAEWFFEGAKSAMKTGKLDHVQEEILIGWAKNTVDETSVLSLQLLARNCVFPREVPALDIENVETCLDNGEALLDSPVTPPFIPNVATENIDPPKGCCVIS